MDQNHLRITDFNVGVMYLEGNGVQKNLGEALRLISMSAHDGYHKAQHQLAMMYKAGIGVDVDYAEAFKWLKLSINGGSSQALRDLAEFYEHGLGCDVNIAEASRLRTEADLVDGGVRDNSKSFLKEHAFSQSSEYINTDYQNELNLIFIWIAKILGFIVGLVACFVLIIGVLGLINYVAYGYFDLRSLFRNPWAIILPFLMAMICATQSTLLLSKIVKIWKKSKFFRLSIFGYIVWGCIIFLYLFFIKPHGMRIFMNDVMRYTTVWLLPPTIILILIMFYNKFVK